MTVDEINQEILRTKNILDKTKSEFLKSDYQKHLQKLYRQRDKAVLLNGKRTEFVKR